MELLDYSTINCDNIIFRSPGESDKGWYSEVWYKTETNVSKLIVQAPRIRVLYGTKEFETNGKKTYTYTVSFKDEDINTDIRNFLNFVKSCDKQAVTTFKQKKRSWNIDFGSGNRVIYKSVVTKKTVKHPFMMKIKLLQNTEGKILTDIKSNDRTGKDQNDIIYGSYIDQYLEFAGLSITKEGKIYPIWYAHQIVISHQERVFLDKLLLDDITPAPPAPPPAPIHPIHRMLHMPPMQPMQSQAPTRNEPNKATNKPNKPNKPIMAISPADLLSVKSKLRSVPPEEDKEINLKELLDTDIMLDSVKNISKKKCKRKSGK